MGLGRLQKKREGWELTPRTLEWSLRSPRTASRRCSCSWQRGSPDPGTRRSVVGEEAARGPRGEARRRVSEKRRPTTHVLSLWYSLSHPLAAGVGGTPHAADDGVVPGELLPLEGGAAGGLVGNESAREIRGRGRDDADEHPRRSEPGRRSSSHLPPLFGYGSVLALPSVLRACARCLSLALAVSLSLQGRAWERSWSARPISPHVCRPKF